MGLEAPMFKTRVACALSVAMAGMSLLCAPAFAKELQQVQQIKLPVPFFAACGSVRLCSRGLSSR
jgi:hypothetical protein